MIPKTAASFSRRLFLKGAGTGAGSVRLSAGAIQTLTRAVSAELSVDRQGVIRVTTKTLAARG